MHSSNAGLLYRLLVDECLMHTLVVNFYLELKNRVTQIAEWVTRLPPSAPCERCA